MNKDSKKISRSMRPQIDTIKSNIRNSTSGFDGDGYVFKKALSELIKEGYNIKLNCENWMYYKIEKQNNQQLNLFK